MLHDIILHALQFCGVVTLLVIGVVLFKQGETRGK
jgi:hypothetical protein